MKASAGQIFTFMHGNGAERESIEDLERNINDNLTACYGDPTPIRANFLACQKTLDRKLVMMYNFRKA